MGVRLKNQSGQMTVEFVVVFPVALIICVITVNALLFFSECAAFDRVAKEAVRIHASSPAYRQNFDQTAFAIEQELNTRFEKDYLSSSIEFSTGASGYVHFVARLKFSPTLFGIGLRSEVFGVALPQLEHASSFVIDSYKPGVVL